MAADDFAALRAVMAKRWGTVRLANAVTCVKSVFRFGYESGLMERPVRYGSEFAKPSQAVIRGNEAKQQPKMLDAEQVRAMIDGSLVVGKAGPELVKPDAALRAMIFLSVSCG